MGTFFRHSLLAVLVLLLSIGPARAEDSTHSASDRDSGEFFLAKIEPLLRGHCYECHADEAEGGLRLNTPAGLAKGGNSGKLMIPGRPNRSLLIRALSHVDDDLQMPPGEKLSKKDVDVFRHWIRLGAIDPRRSADATVDAYELDHWSFQLPSKPITPKVREAGWPTNDIDNFILQRLETEELQPSGDADRATLIRRLYHDLIGLPPTYDAIQAFKNNTSNKAYHHLVDELLQSAHFGERWGRHWLDVARYADAGDRQKWFPFAYTYRDWVIESLNQDMPFNEFITKQLAADLMPNASKKDLAALGFLTLGYNYFRDIPEVIDDRIDTVSRGLMALTVSCARCHDHKFDPITTQDFYALFNIFQNTEELSWNPVPMEQSNDHQELTAFQEMIRLRHAAIPQYKEKRLAVLTAELREPESVARYLQAANAASDLSDKELEQFSKTQNVNLFILRRWRDLLDSHREKPDSPLRIWFEFSSLSQDEFRNGAEEICHRLRQSASTPVIRSITKTVPRSLEEVSLRIASTLAGATTLPDADEHLRRVLLTGPDSPNHVSIADFHKLQTEGDSNNVRGLYDKVTEAIVDYSYRGAPRHASAARDRANRVEGFVFVRGNPNHRGASVNRRFLRAFSELDDTFHEGSGRLQLAERIASERNPLTARVFVNRVWGYLFGTGLVSTYSDFGRQGDRPSHPELLDHLSIRFMEHNWSVKELIRTIVLSRTYRQASFDRPVAREKDPVNRLFWRMNRRRKGFEAMRDSMLAVAGNLDPTMGGLPIDITANPSPGRRTLYGFIDRNLIPTVYQTFDFASPDQHCPQRFKTTIPQQALHLLNGRFVAEQAACLISDEEIAASTDISSRIQLIFRKTLGRDPNLAELHKATAFINNELDPRDSTVETWTPDWSYGLVNVLNDKVAGFRPFRFFHHGQWQQSSLLPNPRSGRARLNGGGGTPGDDIHHAVVRRWTATDSGTYRVTGTISHQANDSPLCDGIDIFVIKAEVDPLFKAQVNTGEQKIELAGVKMTTGETLDFVVSCRNNSIDDDFRWIVTIETDQGNKLQRSWNSNRNFRGPRSKPLDAWERFAQVLLMSNEFLTVD